MEPWNKILVTIWEFATKGWRKYWTVPVFLALVALGILASAKKNIEDLIPVRKVTTLTDDEHDIYDAEEWALLVSSSSSLSDLKEDKEDLVRDLSQLDFIAWDGERLKDKDVLIVRSQFAEGEYLLVIDLYREDISTRNLYEETLSKLRKLGNRGSRFEDIVDKWFGPAKVFKCSRREFEKLYGTIKAKPTRYSSHLWRTSALHRTVKPPVVRPEFCLKIKPLSELGPE